MNLELASVHTDLIVEWLILKQRYVTSRHINCSLITQTKRICEDTGSVSINFRYKNLSSLDQEISVTGKTPILQTLMHMFNFG